MHRLVTIIEAHATPPGLLIGATPGTSAARRILLTSSRRTRGSMWLAKRRTTLRSSSFDRRQRQEELRPTLRGVPPPHLPSRRADSPRIPPALEKKKAEKGKGKCKKSDKPSALPGAGTSL